MNSSERSQPLRGPKQVVFIMFNRFCSLSEKPFTSDNINLERMPNKMKLKTQACFTLYFKFWEGTSVKSYKIQLPVFLFLVSHQFLYQQILLFYSSLELNSTSEKYFCRKFSFFNGFSQTPHPLNSQNLLSVTKFFSLKCFLIFF